MFRNILILSLLLVSISVASQTFTLQHDNLTRSYIVHLPPNYSDIISPLPVIINMHGLTSQASQQQFYSVFDGIADTAGFIIVYPNGSPNPGGNGNAWNSGGNITNADDVGFISALIDTMNENYNIDLDRVFATGMSNGGFMSYRLTCELGNRIAAMASVTGSLTLDVQTGCTPGRTVPVMQIHGTNDPTVPYAGTFGYLSQTDLIEYWVTKYSCGVAPQIDSIPDIDTTDMCEAVKYTYSGCDDGAEIIFYKIIDGEHTWPSALIDIGVTNRDFHASEQIWLFFKQYSLNGVDPYNGPIMDTATSIAGIGEIDKVQIYPNPFNKQINIGNINNPEVQLTIMDVSGKLVYTRNNDFNGASLSIDTESWAPGIYFISLQLDEQLYTQRIVKLH